MPTSLATTIARHLGADPVETERVLEMLVRDVRHDVARDGIAAVPGLGTFRLFDGTIVFEPDHALALAVNHKYAGLEPLLVSGSDIRYPPAVPVQHEESAAEASPVFGASASASGALISRSGSDIIPPDSGVEGPGIPEDEESSPDYDSLQSAPVAPLFEDVTTDQEDDDDAAPPPEYTEIVPTGFDPTTHEILPREQDTNASSIEPKLDSAEAPGREEWTEQEVPDLETEMPRYVTSVPAFDGSDEDVETDEEELWEEETDAQVWEEPAIAGRETNGGEEDLQEEPGMLAGYEEPAPPAPGPAESPFFEPWREPPPEPIPEPASEVRSDDEDAQPATQEPDQAEPFYPVFDAEEAPDAAVEREEVFAPESTFEPEKTSEPDDAREEEPVTAHAVVYEDPDADMSGAVPPIVVESPPEEESMPVASAEAPPPADIEGEPQRKRSLAPWLVAAVAVLGIAVAFLFLTSRPETEPPPAQVAQNDPPVALPSDTSAAVPADTTGSGTTPPASSPADAVPPATQPAVDVPPMQRPGGIDVNAGGLTLVVASTVSRTSAETVAERFRQQGYTTAIFYGPYGGVTRYRVGVGQFADQRAAETQLESLPDGFPDDAWPMPIRSEMEVYQ